MITAETSHRRRSGIMRQSKSTARSEPAKRLVQMQEDIRKHLWQSYSVRSLTQRSLLELQEVIDEASVPGWNGYGARPVDLEAVEHARSFLESLPMSVPAPEVSADPDGDVALDWFFGTRKALTLSIGIAGRCTFAWMRGARTYRGTEWIEDGIPGTIANALWELAQDQPQVVQQAKQ